MTRKTRSARRRGFLGWLFLLSFIAFNALMTLWFSPQARASLNAEFALALQRIAGAIEAAICDNPLGYFWFFGAAILALLAARAPERAAPDAPIVKSKGKAGPGGPNLVHLSGDGSYSLAVVGESNYQDAIGAICGGRQKKGVHHQCLATLSPEPDNVYDPDAVRVLVRGNLVGYLSRHSAKLFGEEFRRLGVAHETLVCEAEIVGGWERSSGDKGHFGVRLDVIYPVEIVLGR